MPTITIIAGPNDADDWEDIEAALKEADIVAAHGSATVRAGRMDLVQEAQVCNAILNRATQALRVWHQWLAMNELSGDPAFQAHMQQQQQHAVSFETIREALLRDTVMKVFALSDPPQNQDRWTLCYVAGLLKDPILKQRLCTKQGVIDQGFLPSSADARAAENTRKVEKFLSAIVTDWKKNTPTDRTFLDARTKAWDFRTTVAHSLRPAIHGTTTMDDVSLLIDKTLEFAHSVAEVFSGATIVNLPARSAQIEAEAFWAAFAFGIQS